MMRHKSLPPHLFGMFLLAVIFGCTSSANTDRQDTAPAEPDDPDLPGVAPAEGTCGPPAALSAVGQAISNAAPYMTSTCVGFPDDWLMTVGFCDSDEEVNGARVCPTVFSAPEYDPLRLGTYAFASTLADEVTATHSRFEFASLNFNLSWGKLSESIAKLNESLKPESGQLSESQKPFLRFMYGSPLAAETPLDVYYMITKKLPVGSPQNWNVRIAVKAKNQIDPSDGYGFSHSKLVIVDGSNVITHSFDTGRYELALHLTGQPARDALDWFDRVWDSAPADECFSTISGYCDGTDSSIPFLFPIWPQPATWRSANVISLSRGPLGDSYVSTADDALFAGLDATENRIFLFQPGLNPIMQQTKGLFLDLVSETLVDKLARAAALRGVDTKILWGNENEHNLDRGWDGIEAIVGATLSELLDEGKIDERQSEVARCMIHVVPYNGPNNSGGLIPTESHAKFYMLDDGFYIGSQNLYPGELALGNEFADPLVPDLADHGFFVDTTADSNHDLLEDVVNRIVDPLWKLNNPAGATRADILKDDPHATIDCSALTHRNMLVGEGQASSGATYTCIAAAEGTFNFHDVAYDEIAKWSGTGICQMDGGPSASVEFGGTIKVGGELVDGYIRGAVGNPFLTGETDLVGTFEQGYFDLTFEGEETGGNGHYRGTITSGQFEGSDP